MVTRSYVDLNKMAKKTGIKDFLNDRGFRFKKDGLSEKITLLVQNFTPEKYIHTHKESIDR